MHAIVLKVTINDREAAATALQEQVVPRVSSAPGFVGGYWVALSGSQGTSVAVFESEDAARALADQIQPPGDFVTFDSVEVGEVVAHA
jgi:4-diphosphocytidyl-2C-methyl-D-erythritol kinase